MTRKTLTIWIAALLSIRCVAVQANAVGYDDSLSMSLTAVLPDSLNWTNLSSFPTDDNGVDLYLWPNLDISCGIDIPNVLAPDAVYAPIDWSSASSSPEIVAASVDTDPDVLNLASQGKWITCYITLPSPYDVTDIDGTTILLNETVPPTWRMIEEEEQILKLKFDRAAVQSLLVPGEVELMITGLLTGEILFESFDSITIIEPGLS